MNTEIDEIVIKGVTYVPKGSEQAETLDGLEYVIIRADRAGVFAGYLEKKGDTEVVLRQARRLWYWAGAASISQLAIDGTSRPENCQFPAPVNKILIKNWIEIIPTTEKAQKSIAEVKVWAA